jgi:60 kDa SS-A/Ro ribonucleoprotein
MNSIFAPPAGYMPTSRIPGPTGDGFTFTIDKWQRLTRFLVMGTEGGSFTLGEKELTLQNARSLLECILEDGIRVVHEIVLVSKAGRAVKNSPAIFALAVCAANGDHLATRRAACEVIEDVCRTGTHLFEFAEYVNKMRGWGRTLKTGVATWYTNKDLDKLAYQLVKYQQREGWSHRDLLRLSHPKVNGLATRTGLTASTDRLNFSNLLKWVVKGPEVGTLYPDVVVAFEEAKTAPKERVIELIRQDGLTHEMIPTQLKNDPDVADALFQNMPLTAMIRNLANYTIYGVLGITGRGQINVDKACVKLADAEYIHKSRVHPLTILLAMQQYLGGRSEQKDGQGRITKVKTWSPITKLVKALEGAFYLAFANVEPTGLNYCFGIDVSGSMTRKIPQVPQVSSCMVAAALALTIAKTEKNYAIAGFATNIVKLDITAEDTLQTAMHKAQMRNFGSTNAAALITKATSERLPIDVFVIITDNDVNTGGNPAGALRVFRKVMNRPKAKLIVLSTYASNISIADPSDAGMYDFAGFDANVPAMIAAAARE